MPVGARPYCSPPSANIYLVGGRAYAHIARAAFLRRRRRRRLRLAGAIDLIFIIGPAHHRRRPLIDRFNLSVASLSILLLYCAPAHNQVAQIQIFPSTMSALMICDYSAARRLYERSCERSIDYNRAGAVRGSTALLEMVSVLIVSLHNKQARDRSYDCSRLFLTARTMKQN